MKAETNETRKKKKQTNSWDDQENPKLDFLKDWKNHTNFLKVWSRQRERTHTVLGKMQDGYRGGF